MKTTLGCAFGRAVKKLRKDAKLSQMQLAADAGIHLNALSVLERGLNVPNLLTIQLIAKTLKISMTTLIDMVEAELPKK